MLHKRLFVCLASLFLTSSVLHAKVKDGKLKIDDTKKIYSLTGTWKFRPEDKAEFSRLDFDDSGWKMIRVPLSWHQDGIEYDGASWFRMKVLIDGSYKDKGIGVILPYIDASYEFFFNDEIVGRSGEISNSGELIKASSKIEKIIIPRKLVRHGRENLVALRVRSYGGVGGFVTPYAYIGEKTIIHDKYTSYLIWNGILAGILIFVGLNHLMTFIGRLKESHYLFFGLYSISIGFEVIGIKTLGYWIYDSYFFNTYLLNFGLCTFCISLLSFFYSFYQIPKRDFVYISFLSIFGITTISFFLGTFSPQLFYIYAKYFLPAMLLAVILALGYTAYLSFRAVQQRVFGANIIICGFLVTLLTVTNDILSYLELIHSEKYAEEGILIFVVSMAVAVSFKFSHVHKESEILNLDLDEKIRQLETVQEEMQKSEEKYRNLVESSKDIIFSLNGNNEIITINKAIFNLLGLRPDRLIGRNFLELIYKSQTESAISLNKLIVNEKLEETIRNRKEASFRAEFLTNNNEPKELEVKVEYVETDGNEFVLFGKASGVTEDTIMRLCESERQRYVLGNFITISEVLSQRLTAGTAKFVGLDMALDLKISLREILVNAMEHGNLGITFEEKTLAQEEGNYIEFLQERQKSAACRDKKVVIDYSLNSERVAFRITDEGNGFDHRRMMTKTPAEMNALNLGHGRGIFMAKSIFDRIQYNSKGNQVVLLKYFKEPEFSRNL